VTFRITHRTSYRYPALVSSSYSEARLAPRDEHDQAVRSSSVDVWPMPSDRSERHDFFGNRVTFFSVHEPHRELVVTSTCEVDVERRAPPEQLLVATWEGVLDRLGTDPDPDLLHARQFCIDSPLVQRSATLRAYAEPSFVAGQPLVESLLDLSARLHTDFEYDPGATSISTHPEELLELRRGVCQDFAHVMIGCVRSMGLAARYASGYLETVPPPGQPRLVGADASHAWVSVLVPDVGWIDVDPTNDVLVADRHVTVAWGRDFADVTPIKGVVFGQAGAGAHELEVSVDVERI
jgi:transglutaminase-like putative cysteine protease